MNLIIGITGRAGDEDEIFEFSIDPYGTGGFLLSIRYSGHRIENVVGAGVWPTVQKAKQIAEKTAASLLHGAIVAWNESTDV